MREAFADILRCPACRTDGTLSLSAAEADEREVRRGELSCERCGHVVEVRDGIVDCLHDPPEFVRREAAGLLRFVEEMRAQGWDRARVLNLPMEHSGYWFTQAALMNQVLHTVNFQRGDRVLDIGSNTCWASAMFAERHLEAVALDISEHEMQGLRTAQWWMDDKGLFMERVLGVMYDLPFAGGSFEFIWANEVLHHNDPDNLRRTCEEAFRVLRPGGQLVVCNEPLRTLRDPKLDPGRDVAHYEGHEHAFVRRTYTRAAERAGFDVDVRGPWYRGVFQVEEFRLSNRMSVRQLYATATAMAMRRSPALVRAYLAALSYVFGGVSLHMVCTKPGRLPGR